MKQRFLLKLLAVAFAVAVPVISFASNDDEPDGIDARLKGYKEGTLALKDAGGTAITWILLIILTALCVGVMFINSKRTHLD